MKTLYPFTKNVAIAIVLLFTALKPVFSQTIPELVFRNGEHTNGQYGQNGSKYLFRNAAPGIDVELQIKNRSANNVKVSSIDSTSIGWDKALQPIVGIEGTIAPNQEWWVRFSLTFYTANTKNKIKLNRFFATGIDIDGDNVSIREWVQMEKVSTVAFAQSTTLASSLLGTVNDLVNFNNSGCDYKLMGPVANFENIDTSATTVMAGYQYDNKDYIEFVLGGVTGSASSSAGMRMNSLWFRQFSLTPGSVLPVNLVSFNAANNNGVVNVNWKSENETNFSHYVVQRSYDNREYSDIATLFADELTTGTKVYQLNDRQVVAAKGIAYYRLVMVNKDGSEKVSDVKVVRFGKANPALTLSVFPNPAVSDVKVTMSAELQNKAGKITITNTGGKLMKTISVARLAQTEMISLTGLPAGVYTISVETEGQHAVSRFVKN